MMKIAAPIAALSLLMLACSDGPERKGGGSPATVANGTILPGFYSNMPPTSEMPAVGTELWIYPDSSFILRTSSGGDAFPTGIFGTWHMVDGMLATGSGTDKPEFWKPTANGLLHVGEDGMPFQDATEGEMVRAPSAQMDNIPPMRVQGLYRYAADSHSFRPLGSPREYPLAVGDLVGVMLEALTGSADLKREKLCVEIECALTPGPAMEGEGTDEYVQLFQLVRALPANTCE